MLGQPRHHRLVFVDELQRALARLGLVRRVRRIELAARDDRPDRGRDVVLVRAGTGEVERRAVLRGALLHEARDVHLRQARRHLGQRLDLERGRNLVEEILDIGDADRLEHGGDVGFGMGNEGHGKSRDSGIGIGDSVERRGLAGVMQRDSVRRTHRIPNLESPVPASSALRSRSARHTHPDRAALPCPRRGGRA